MELNRFSRTELLIGDKGLSTLADKHTMVCGIGGVGSYAAEALGRAGVGKITLVDFDDICISNINRQIHALSSTIGRSKVGIMSERLLDINPNASIVAIKEFFSQSNAERILTPKPDFVLDAIDNFTAKVSLITICREHGIPIISSMGAANKLDPTKIEVSDISQTKNCRMARSMRRILKKNGITSGVQVVYSTEIHRDLALLDTHEESAGSATSNHVKQASVNHEQKVILGSISYIPSITGLTMAGVVINELLKNSRCTK
ncbi:MAG: tRNA threonylcarbamoyladenosine dehydratase [Desulfuromonadaceae bacterium]|nr:tRNA threonylcarbamoyladenosine dehydratase [Desulfuromonadaceae bacterium]MDD2854301.1 tRNA threonylcarbamoyladenosine dehydratase [Desulfuromonadaceae bacterium]